MKARDRLLPITDYKGRLTDCCEAVCPCRPCWHAHDCGRMMTGANNRLVWWERMECATRHNNGCPRPLPEPVHVHEKTGPSGRTRHFRRCQRCGAMPVSTASQEATP